VGLFYFSSAFFLSFHFVPLFTPYNCAILTSTPVCRRRHCINARSHHSELTSLIPFDLKTYANLLLSVFAFISTGGLEKSEGGRACSQLHMSRCYELSVCFDFYSVLVLGEVAGPFSFFRNHELEDNEAIITLVYVSNLYQISTEASSLLKLLYIDDLLFSQTENWINCSDFSSFLFIHLPLHSCYTPK